MCNFEHMNKNPDNNFGQQRKLWQIKTHKRTFFTYSKHNNKNTNIPRNHEHIKT